MHEIRDLPADKEKKTQGNKALGIGVVDDDERRKHHCIVPIIDAAGVAALIFHHPRLKRAEKEDTDHVTDGVEYREENHYAPVEYAFYVQSDENRIQEHPERQHRNRAPGRLLQKRLPVNRLRRNKIFAELLLAAHALIVRREASQYHFNGIYCKHRYP